MPNINTLLKSHIWIVLSLFSTAIIISFLYVGDKASNEMEMEGNADTYFENLKKGNESRVNFLDDSNRDLSRVSLYEGVDIRIEGVQVGDVFFDKGNSNGIEVYHGKWEWDHNRIRLDPDLPNRGLPDFITHVSQLTPLFSNDGFFDQLFDERYALSKNLKEALSKFRKIDSFRWLNGDDYIEIQQHVLGFHVDVGTQYNTKNDFEYDLPSDVKRDVLGNKFDRDREWDRKRYPSTQVILKFTPQSFNLTAEDNPRKARFAVAAVEVIGIEYPKLDDDDAFMASRRTDGGFGADADIKKGILLPLYNRVEDMPLIKSKYDLTSSTPPQNYTDLSKAILPFKNLEGKSKGEILNDKIFDNAQYSVISIANIGTWREGNAFVGKDLYAESVRFKFAMHLFVYGDWVARFNPVATWDAIKVQSHSEESFIDRALSGLWNGFVPSLNLGNFGRVIFIIFALIILSPFIPAIMQLIQLTAFVLTKILKIITNLGKGVSA